MVDILQLKYDLYFSPKSTTASAKSTSTVVEEPKSNLSQPSTSKYSELEEKSDIDYDADDSANRTKTVLQNTLKEAFLRVSSNRGK